MFTTLLRNFSAALPSSCHICRSFGAQAVCGDCTTRFATQRLRCHTCALPLPASAATTAQPRCGACLSLGSALDAVHAAVDYRYPWDRLLQRLKYSGDGDLQAQPALANALVHVMQQVAAQDSALQQALHQAERADWIIPIPLHPQRQRERGFNQSQHLAQALWPGHSRIRSDLLLRIKDTAMQAHLERDERASNLRSAFIAAPLHTAQLKACRITLIDDVSTTGSTLAAAAQALRQAGAVQVQAIVFARTA
jgi:ComF family protein